MQYKKLLEYKIRDFIPADYKNLVKLWQLVGLYNPTIDKRQVILRKYRQDKRMILIAETKKKLIGSILGIGDGWRGSLWRLAVHPQYQNKGVGTRLVKGMENRLKRMGCKRIFLLIDKKFDNSNRLMRFYKKLGYKKNDRYLYMGKKF